MFEENSYCRSCGISKSETYIDLNGTYQDRNWSDIFYDCIGIDIKKDTYSRYLCGDCYNKLMNSYKFRLLCYETNEKLIKQFGKLEIKQEIDEHLGPIDVITQEQKIENNAQVEILVRPFDIGIPYWSDEDDDYSNRFSPDYIKSKDKPTFKLKKVYKNKQQNFEEDDGIAWRRQLCLGVGCKKGFTTFAKLNDHYKKMKGEPDHLWCCDICSKNFNTKLNLSNHIKRLHKESTCKECNETFSGNKNLTEHNRKVHIASKIHTCTTCNKVFSTRRLLKIHIKCVHEKEMNFSCHYCGKKSFNKINLTYHMRVHTNEKPFQCSIEGCDKRFTQRGQLRRHELTHDTAQNYSCDVCGIKIKSRHYLSQHRKIHFYDMQFKCDVCDMSFARPNYLKEHKKHRHNATDTSVVCPECGKTFKSQKNLNAHMNYHRETDHVCPQCNKMFPRKQLLKEHIIATHDQIRKWICVAEGCDKAYYRSSHLRHHEKVVHLKGKPAGIL